MRLLLLIFLFTFPNWLFAQYLELDNYHVEVGDSVVVIVRYEDPYKSIRKIKFEVLDSIKQLSRLSDKKQEYSTTTGKVYTTNFVAFDTGDIIIPPIPLVIEDLGTTSEIYTNSVTLKITNPKLDSTETNIAPIKDIEEVKIYWYDNWPLYLNIFLAILLILVLYFVFRKKKNQQEEAPPVEIVRIPPYEKAMERLEDLEKSDLLSSGHYIAFYTELSHIYREYLSNALGIEALEASTTEIKAKLANTILEKPMIDQSIKLMQLFDKVKFAKQNYSNEINETMINTTRNHIDTMESFIIKSEDKNEDTVVS